MFIGGDNILTFPAPRGSRASHFLKVGELRLVVILIDSLVRVNIDPILQVMSVPDSYEKLLTWDMAHVDDFAGHHDAILRC